MPRALALTLALLAGSAARAEGLDQAWATARCAGRAGACVVSTDGREALVANPAGLARNGRGRADAGVLLVSSDARYTPEGGAVVRDLGGPRLLASVGGSGRLGPVVAGFALLPTLAAAASLPGAQFSTAAAPHRYAGTRLTLSGTTLAAGVALHALPWLAVGGSVLASEVALQSDRWVWSGFAATPPTALDASYDQRFSAAARDGFVPGLALGAVVAPLDAPLELALSFVVSADAELAGAPDLDDSRGEVAGSAAPLVSGSVSTTATARLALPMPTVARAGVRFLAERFTVEADAELRWRPRRAPAFILDGVVASPDGGTPRTLGEIPLGLETGPGYALRGSVEAHLVPGFLVATGGLAYGSATASRAALSPVAPGGAAVTWALGLEANIGDAAVAFALARSALRARRVTAAESSVAVVAPLSTIGVAAVAGETGGTGTTVAVDVEWRW